jgi:hypothetical protein
LPTPGSPISTALFLVRRRGPAGPVELVLAADQRIEMVLHRRLGEVAAEFGRAAAFLDARQRGFLVQQLHDVLAAPCSGRIPFPSGSRRQRALLAQNAEQQMFGADVVVQQPIGFLAANCSTRLVSALNGISTEVETFSRKTVRPSISLRMFSSERCERAKMRLVSPCLRESAQEQVLGLNRDAAELAGLVSGEEEYSPGPFGVPFEHPAYLRESGTNWGHRAFHHSIRHRSGVPNLIIGLSDWIA